MKRRIAAILLSAFAAASFADAEQRRITLIKPPEPTKYMMRNLWHVAPMILFIPSSLLIEMASSGILGSRLSDDMARHQPKFSDALLEALDNEFTGMGYEVTRNATMRADPSQPWAIDQSAFTPNGTEIVYAHYEYIGLYSGRSKSYYEPAVAVSACVNRTPDRYCEIDAFGAYGNGYDSPGPEYFSAKPDERWFSASEVSISMGEVKTAMKHGVSLIANGIAKQVHAALDKKYAAQSASDQNKLAEESSSPKE